MKYTEFIDAIIRDLIHDYENYEFYCESDIIFVINNFILKKDCYNTLKNNKIIYNEFPIRLQYPRVITANTFRNYQKNYRFNKDYFDGKINNSNHYRTINKKYIKEFKEYYYENERPDDAGRVYVDMTMVNKNLYDSFKDKDELFGPHDLVMEFKFEKQLKNLRKNKTHTSDLLSMRKDILKIDSIVEDGKSNVGCFIFISEDGAYDNIIIEGNMNLPVEKHTSENARFIYIYKKFVEKDGYGKKIYF